MRVRLIKRIKSYDKTLPLSVACGRSLRGGCVRDNDNSDDDNSDDDKGTIQSITEKIFQKS